MERAERTGLAIATVGHVLLFGALSLGLLTKSKPLPPMNDPIDVQLVDAIAPRSAAPEISQEAPASAAAPEAGPPEEAAPEPAPEPEPEPSPAPPPPPKPAPPRPAPKPTPKPTPPAPTKPAPTPKPVPPKPAPKPTPPKPAPAKPDKAPAKSAPAKPAPAKAAADAPAKPATRPTTAKGAPAKAAPAAKPGAGAGKKTSGGLLSDDFLKGITPEKSEGKAQTPRAAMTGAQANALGALIREQLKPYWSPPAGTDVSALVTTLRVRLNRDGSLAGAPEVLRTTGQNASNKGYVRQHQDAARRAVLRAVPLKRLPAEFYEDWKELDTNFDNRLAG